MRIGRGLPVTAVVGVAAMVGLMGVRSWAGDPRVEGVLPHAVPDVDMSILSGPGSGVRAPTGRGAAAPVRTTAPESAPAVKADFTTPKATAKTLMTATLKGDRATMKACYAVPANDEEKALLENGFPAGVAEVGLFVTVMEKFPDMPAGGGMPDVKQLQAGAAEEVNGLTEKIDGEKATLTKAGSVDPNDVMALVKGADGWHIVVAAGQGLEKFTPEQQAINKDSEDMYLGLLTDVKGGKFATFADFAKEYVKKVEDFKSKHGGVKPNAIEGLEAGPPATGPGGAPTTGAAPATRPG